MVVCYTGKNVLFLEIITFNYQGQNTKSLSSSNIYKCKEPFLYFAPNSFLPVNKKKDTLQQSVKSKFTLLTRYR